MLRVRLFELQDSANFPWTLYQQKLAARRIVFSCEEAALEVQMLSLCVCVCVCLFDPKTTLTA